MVRFCSTGSCSWLTVTHCLLPPTFLRPIGCVRGNPLTIRSSRISRNSRLTLNSSHKCNKTICFTSAHECGHQDVRRQIRCGVAHIRLYFQCPVCAVILLNPNPFPQAVETFNIFHRYPVSVHLRSVSLDTIRKYSFTSELKMEFSAQVLPLAVFSVPSNNRKPSFITFIFSGTRTANLNSWTSVVTGSKFLGLKIPATGKCGARGKSYYCQ